MHTFYVTSSSSVELARAALKRHTTTPLHGWGCQSYLRNQPILVLQLRNNQEKRLDKHLQGTSSQEYLQKNLRTIAWVKSMQKVYTGVGKFRLPSVQSRVLVLTRNMVKKTTNMFNVQGYRSQIERMQTSSR